MFYKQSSNEVLFLSEESYLFVREREREREMIKIFMNESRVPK